MYSVDVSIELHSNKDTEKSGSILFPGVFTSELTLMRYSCGTSSECTIVETKLII